MIAKFNAKTPAKSKLTISGVFDFGSGVPNLALASTLDVGGLHRDIPGLTLAKNGKSYSFSDPPDLDRLTLTITPNAGGSSKAAFSLTVTGDLTGKIPSDGQLALKFVDDVATAKATVNLAGGEFKSATPHGGLLDPGMFIGKASANAATRTRPM